MKLKQIAETITAPVAPPKPERPVVRPSTEPKPDFKPFNPPRPKEDPKPKAKKRKRNELTEAFDDSANRSVVDFWKNIRQGQHPYAKHPLMAMYGYESAQKAYENSADRVKRAFPQLRSYDLNSIGNGAAQIMQQVMGIESRFKNELQDIAVNVVSKVWGVPHDILNAQLTQNTMLGDEDVDDGDEDGDEDVDDGDEDVDDGEINKRITMNALTQGAAVHNMMTMHRLVEKELNNLSPKLLNAYDKIGSGAEHTYWLMDYARLAGLANTAIGTAQVKYDEQNQPMVMAKAWVFPVLIQELVKGVMELLSHHGLSHLSKGQLKKVYEVADKTEDEPWLIQVGPHLWRSFLKIVPDNSRLAETVAKIGQKDPKFVHDLLSRTIEAVHSDSDIDNIKQEVRKVIDEVSDYSSELT